MITSHTGFTAQKTPFLVNTKIKFPLFNSITMQNDVALTQKLRARGQKCRFGIE